MQMPTWVKKNNSIKTRYYMLYGRQFVLHLFRELGLSLREDGDLAN
jgi:hypothetical protein